MGLVILKEKLTNFFKILLVSILCLTISSLSGCQNTQDNAPVGKKKQSKNFW